MKKVILGATGSIGSSLAKKLVEDKNKVFGVDNLNNYYDVNLKKDRMENLNGLARKLDKKSFTIHDIDLTNYSKMNIKKYVPGVLIL